MIGRGGRGGRGGARGGRGGMAGGSKVAIEAHRHEGVFVAHGKEDALVTRNMVPGEAVYGEKRITIEVLFSVHFVFANKRKSSRRARPRSSTVSGTPSAQSSPLPFSAVSTIFTSSPAPRCFISVLPRARPSRTSPTLLARYAVKTV